MRATNNQISIKLLQIIVLILASICLYQFSRLSTKNRRETFQPLPQAADSHLVEIEELEQALVLVDNYQSTPVPFQSATTTIGRNLFVSQNRSQFQSHPKVSLTTPPSLAMTTPIVREALPSTNNASANTAQQQVNTQANTSIGNIIADRWQVVAISTNDIEMRDLQSGRHYHINPSNSSETIPQLLAEVQPTTTDKVASVETSNLAVELFTKSTQPKTYQQLLQQRALNKRKAGKP